MDCDLVYPNTKSGVLLYLRDETDINITCYDYLAEVESDPCVDGVRSDLEIV